MDNRLAIVHVNGSRFECFVDNVTITQENDPGFGISRYLNGVSAMPGHQTIEMAGTITKITEDKDMDRDCEKACDSQGYGKTLAVKYKELELDDNTRLFRKHGLVTLDGTLTEKGKDFLLNIILEDCEDDVVEALKNIEEAEKEAKKSCE